MFVLGFETDFSGWDLSASSGVSSFGPTTLSATSSINSNWLFTARPRIGFANGNMLTYLTGGLAVSNISLAQSILLSAAGPTLAGSASSTQLGWTAGAASNMRCRGTGSSRPNISTSASPTRQQPRWFRAAPGPEPSPAT